MATLQHKEQKERVELLASRASKSRRRRRRQRRRMNPPAATHFWLFFSNESAAPRSIKAPCAQRKSNGKRMIPNNQGVEWPRSYGTGMVEGPRDFRRKTKTPPSYSSPTVVRLPSTTSVTVHFLSHPGQTFLLDAVHDTVHRSICARLVTAPTFGVTVACICPTESSPVHYCHPLDLLSLLLLFGNNTHDFGRMIWYWIWTSS